MANPALTNNLADRLDRLAVKRKTPNYKVLELIGLSKGQAWNLRHRPDLVSEKRLVKMSHKLYREEEITHLRESADRARKIATLNYELYLLTEEQEHEDQRKHWQAVYFDRYKRI